MTRVFYIIIFLFVTPLVQAQKVKKFTAVPLAGYTWQGTNNIDFGFQPMVLLDAKSNHSNIGLDITANLMFRYGTVYCTPMTKLRLMPHTRKRFNHLGWSMAVGHSYTHIYGGYDQRITPEIGVKWEWYNLTFGYNFPISGYTDGVTSLYRVAFSLNLF